MSITSTELKFLLLIFGIIFIAVFLVRKAVKKVYTERGKNGTIAKSKPPVEKSLLTEEQFNRSWKALSILLLLAAAGSLYMVFTGVRSALTVQNGAWIFWFDAVFSLLAAAAAVMVWRRKEKIWVYIYFFLTLIPIFLFMSIKGTTFKVSALIHLFPLVLFYFVLQPVWRNLKD